MCNYIHQPHLQGRLTSDVALSLPITQRMPMETCSYDSRCMGLAHKNNCNCWFVKEREGLNAPGF
jgi:hypothetical protein